MHTPGPWTIQKMAHEHPHRKGCNYNIRDERNCCIATVGRVDAITDGAEAKANAHLVASAPTMLARLENILADCETWEDDPDVMGNLISQIKAECRQAITSTKDESGPHTFSDAVDQSFKEEIRVIHGYAERYCEECDHTGHLCGGGCDCSKNPLVVRKNNTISRLRAALGIVELETTRAFKYIKGAHSSPEIIRYLVMKLYACNDAALDGTKAKGE